MHQTLSFLSQIFLCIFGFSFLSATATLAQITPDNTLDTQVDSNGKVSEITGGQTRGDNLFHSFQDFSVPTGTEAYFNNNTDVANIFSRVTGGNVSTIDGLIRANGGANLFLINPAGIIFGEGAQLDIGGSFLGSTASSILFPEGEFSATDVDNPPLLTINAPIGLGLAENPREIVNRSVVRDSEANPVGLKVLSGNNLSLVGGNIKFEGGNATARGGKVELGGLSTAGRVDISENGNLNFPQRTVRANVSLSNGAEVNVRADGAGFINVNARNLILSGQSRLFAGIAENQGTIESRAGDITINATDSVRLIGKNTGLVGLDTEINNHVGLEKTRRNNPNQKSNAFGNGGDIVINTRLLEISEQARITANSFAIGNAGNIILNTNNIELNSETIASLIDQGTGDAGNVTINNKDTINVGENSNVTSQVILSQVINGGKGNSGNITINTGSLNLKELSLLLADNQGSGNAGNITINAQDSIILGQEANIATQIIDGGQGNAGDIKINTDSLELQNLSRILTANQETGNAGNITINAQDSIILGQQANIGTQIINGGQGNAGDININANKRFSLSGSSLIDSQVLTDAEGDAGNIEIDTGSFTLDESSLILADNQGTGNAGNITINASDEINLNDKSLIISQVQDDVVGDAGNINIFSPLVTLNNFSLISTNVKESSVGRTGNISLTVGTLRVNNGSVIDALTQNNFDGGDIDLSANQVDLNSGGKIVTSGSGGGKAGSLNFEITDTLIIDNNSPPSESPFEELILQNLKSETGLFANTIGDATGNGGSIDVRAGSIQLENSGSLSAATSSGLGGNITLQVEDSLFLQGSSSLSAEAGSFGDGGNINIDTEFLVAFPSASSGGNDIIANAFRGQGGSIDITSQGVFGIESRENLTPFNDITASSEFGISGEVTINTPEVNPSQDSLNIPTISVDTEVVQTCEPSSNDNQSEFVVTGRGGLPPEPEDNFRLPALATADNTIKSESSTQQPEISQPIIEATTWVRNEKGKILLLASPSTASSLNAHSNSANCS